MLASDEEGKARDEPDGASEESSALAETATAEPPTEPPLPWAGLISVCWALMCNSLQITIVFPFVGNFVEHLGMTDDHRAAGYTAGLLASAFMVGRITTSFVWGIVADSMGRRTVLLVGCASCGITTLAFGLSPTFAFALLTRFVMGLMNGVVGVGKATVSELVPESQQQRAMALITATWSLGLMAGPALGGLLYAPVEEGFLADFPAMLPCLVVSFVSVVSTLFVWRYLPETLPASSARPLPCWLKPISWLCCSTGAARPGQAGGDDGHGQFTRLEMVGLTKTDASASPDQRSGAEEQANSAAITAGAFVIDDDSDVEGDEEAGMALGSHHRHVASTSPVANASPAAAASSAADVATADEAASGALATDEAKAADAGRSLLYSGTVLHLLVLYSVWSMAVMCIDESVPIWTRISVRHGGLNASPKALGFMAIATGCCLFAFQLGLYARVAKWLGSPIRVVVVGALLNVPLSFAMPSLPFLFLPSDAPQPGEAQPDELSSASSDAEESVDTTNALVVLTVIQCIRAVATSMAFTSTFLLINSSTPSSLRGSLNGLAMTIGSIGKAIGPEMGTALLSWSLLNGLGYPFDWHFVFLLMGLVALAVAVMAAVLPSALAHPYDSPGGMAELRAARAAAGQTGSKWCRFGRPARFSRLEGADPASSEEEEEEEEGIER